MLFGQTWDTILLQGDQPPGLPAGVQFSSTPASIRVSAKTGDVLISKELEGVGVNSTNDRAIWVWRNGSLNLIVRSGDLAPGDPDGGTFDSFESIYLINDLGDVLFRIRASSSGPSKRGLWGTQGQGPLTKLYLDGDSAPPPIANATMRYPDSWWFDDSSQIAVSIETVGDGIDSSNNGCLLRGLPGSMELIAREGDAAPGFSDTAIFGGRYFSLRGVFNQQVLFTSQIDVDSVSNANGLFVADNSGIRAVAVSGESNAYGIPTINVIRSAANSLGKIAFTTSTIEAGTELDVFWQEHNGVRTLLGKTGDATPIEGVLFEDFTDIRVNDSGWITFESSLALGGDVDSTNNKAIWRVNDDLEFELLARLGDLAPGNNGDTFKLFLSYQLNNLNDYVIVSRTPETTQRAIFAGNSNDDLRLIVEEDQLFEVAPGIVKTIKFLPNSAYIDDQGRVVTTMFFTDGTTGVFRFNPVPEPELLGDCNLDGVVNFSDIDPFIQVLSGGEFLAEADFIEDGVINFLDIAPFIVALSSQ